MLLYVMTIVATLVSTAIAFDKDRIFATGTCNEEFASRIFTIPVPVKNPMLFRKLPCDL